MVESNPGGMFTRRECEVRRLVLFWSVWYKSGFSRRKDVLTFNLH